MAKKKKEHGLLRFMTAAAVGAAASYFFYGPDRAKNRKKARAWMYKAKAEVLEELENVSDNFGEKEYQAVVDKVAKKYKTAKYVEPSELRKLERELKGQWKKIARHLPKQSSKKRKTK